MDSENRDKTVAEPATIQYVVYESAMARNERSTKQLIEHHDKTNKRLITIIIILIVFLFGTNGIWIIRDLQYNYADLEVTADGNANANYIGGDMDGDINNGGKNQSENQDKKDGSERQENQGEGESESG